MDYYQKIYKLLTEGSLGFGKFKRRQKAVAKIDKTTPTPHSLWRQHGTPETKAKIVKRDALTSDLHKSSLKARTPHNQFRHMKARMGGSIPRQDHA